MAEEFVSNPRPVRHVLVPVDGSELALQAMPTARVLAARFGAELQTVSVATRDEDPDHLRALAAAALGVDASATSVCVTSGVDPAEAIAARARELEDCVVCMSSHGRGRLHGALVGSVARSVLLGSAEPMVVLGPSADNPGWSPRPRSWPEPLSTPRIVACVDGSDGSEQVLPVAASWAALLEMSLTIVTVIGDEPSSIGAESTNTTYGSHANAASYLDALATHWRREVNLDVDSEVLRSPIGPASGIRAYLAGRPAGLIAVTTHARSGLDRARLGAQAANIVHASIVPCLVAPVTP